MTGAQILSALFASTTVGLAFVWLARWPWKTFLWYVAAYLAFRLTMIRLGVPFLGN